MAYSQGRTGRAAFARRATYAADFLASNLPLIGARLGSAGSLDGSLISRIKSEAAGETGNLGLFSIDGSFIENVEAARIVAGTYVNATASVYR